MKKRNFFTKLDWLWQWEREGKLGFVCVFFLNLREEKEEGISSLIICKSSIVFFAL
jgi:hypothetical protein